MPMNIALPTRPRLNLLVAVGATLLLTLGSIVAAGAQEASPAAPAAGDAAPAFTPVNADGQIEVTLQNHVFTPAEIVVPAGQRTVILLKNMDATADEFDSTSLKVEKVVAGNSSGTVRLRALDPGRYPFMGEYNPSTAQGAVIAR